jgi:DNA recombination protein RmuC
MMEVIIGIIVGLSIGGVACWLVQEFRSKSRVADQSAQHETALSELKAAQEKSMVELQSDHRAKVAGLEGQLEQVASAQRLLDSAKEQLSIEFQAAASKVLQSNSEQFVQLANENLGKTLESAKGEFHQRHQQFQELVKPLSENYGKLNPQIETLTTQVNSITTETAKLSSALTDNRQVGSWGEIQLRRVVELAGMVDYCDFVEQPTISVDNKRERPDMVIKLPDNRAVVVDAKASTAAYLEAQQADDEATANAAWSKHANALKGQVDALASKNYGDNHAGSLDFVVMFVPGDQFLAAALGTNPEIIEYAVRKRVAIATPVSLISLLWAIANGWQQDRLARDTRKIKEAGEEMHKRMLTFISHYQKVGRELNQAVDAFNSSVNSFDSRVVPQGRRFAELVTKDEEAFQLPEEIDQLPRTSRYADATESRTDDARPQEV